MEFKCLNKSPARDVCVSPQCEKYAFYCHQLECCHISSHQYCKKMSFQNFLDMVQSSHVNLLSVSKEVSRFYHDVIQEINRDAEIFNKWVCGELGKRETLIKACQMEQKLSGKQIASIVKGFDDYSYEYLQTIVAYSKHWQKNIKNQLNEIKQILMENQRKSQCQRNSRNSNSLFCKQFLTTKIEMSDNEQTSLSEIVSSIGKIKELKKLYTASQCEFSIDKFHSICNKKQNTIILVKTSKGHIYGGFTPIAWESRQNGLYKHDTEHRSFVFCVSNGAIYPLQENNYAIECHSLYGPIFGRRGMIMIPDKANKNMTYWEELPLSYGPCKNQKWTEEEFKQFMGSQKGEKFTLTEWQVYEIIYE